MSGVLRKAVLALVAICPAAPAAANVITDWDAAAVEIVPPSNAGERTMAMMHLAMFDAVNSIEPRYRPYLVQLTAAAPASQEAAAAMAAATVLIALHPEKAQDVKARLASSIAAIADDAAKSEGLKLGEAVATKLLQAREKDGSNAPDAYRPKTKPGAYVPTAVMVGSAWPSMVPLALEKPSQFRPPPPVALASAEWATDYNEIKDYGGRTSTRRSPEQTETARFWLRVGPPAYHPFARQVVAAREMSTVDSARAMALFSVALTDAYVAVFDAKYHYEFWRPITAIRNGDSDDNPATERDAAWQPIDNTPMHPEYPCAHCIESGAAVAVIEQVLGSTKIPEVVMTSPTAPGVTHRWSDLGAFAEEVAQARIWAGFHYRSSTRVGTDMGNKIGRYVCEKLMRPVEVSDRH